MALLITNVMVWDAINDASYPGEVLIEGNRISDVACAQVRFLGIGLKRRLMATVNF